MLNIGRLSPGAADYYLGEIASSAEDYYTGRGETPGRWVGSLAADLGLEDTVEPAQFRAVLDGRHPFTDEQLARPRCGRGPARSAASQPTLFDDDALDLAQVAARLRVGVRRVRQLVWAGERPGTAPDRFLRATRRSPDGRRGRPGWAVPRVEVERLEAARAAQRARPGYDLTLRPPKSVSVLWALAPEAVRAEIRQAHAEAVDQVVAYMEAHAVRARLSDSHRTPVDTDGLIAAAFDHRTSRAGDPLLHTHVVTANLTRTVTGRWQALDARPLYDHARPAGTLYQAHLRHLLTRRLSLRWGPVSKGWAEVAGVPQPVIRAFSKRRDEIEQMVVESGYTSARAHQTATLATRQAKEYGVEPEALLERWRDEAEALGFGPDQLAACLHQNSPAPDPLDEEALFSELAGPEGLTRQASTFQRKEVVEAVAERVADRADAPRVERLVDSFLASGAATPLAGSRDRVMRRTGNLEREPRIFSTTSSLSI
ncbi:MAG: MobF family relaxase [Acidimicrobiales bacterium]